MTKSKKKQHGKKKTSRKEILQTIITDAKGQKDPLITLPPALLSAPLSPVSCTTPNNNDTDNDMTEATIRYFSSPLPPSLLKQCLNLFKTNMAQMYTQSSWGLDVEEKLNELQHSDARFLVVLSSNNDATDENAVTKIEAKNGDTTNDKAENLDINTIDNYEECTVHGFAHFRYELDDDNRPKFPITYLYELQIHPSMQKLGLGKKLMTITELTSLRMQMKRIMLTVFRSNEGAMRFYKNRKYDIDSSSPSNFSGEENEKCDYEILSKPLGSSTS